MPESIQQITSPEIFTIADDGMHPELPKLSRVIIDQYFTKLVSGSIYALCKNNEVFFRRVFKELGVDNYHAKADNPIHENTTFTNENEIKIIGRVVYLLGKEV